MQSPGHEVMYILKNAHTGMKGIRTKANVITLASLGLGQLKKSLKKDEQSDGSAVPWQEVCR